MLAAQLVIVKVAAQFLRDLIDAVPYKFHTVLPDNGFQFVNLKRFNSSTWRRHSPTGWTNRKNRCGAFEVSNLDVSAPHAENSPYNPKRVSP
jgi:hypothetical protein